MKRPLPAKPPLRRRASAATLIVAVFLGAPAMAAKKQPQAAASPEIADKKVDLGELRSRIDGLRKELNASEEHKAGAADRLHESEQQVSRLQRELQKLAAQRSDQQKRLRELEQQSHDLASTLGQQQVQLEKLLYKQYVRGTPDPLQLVLNGDDPNQVTRDLHYLAAIAQTRSELMGEINASLARKKSLAADTKSRADELRQTETEQQQRQAELEKQRESRKQLYAELSNKVKAQRKEIGNLQADERRMSQLIARLSKILAAQAAETARAARAAEAAKAAEAARVADAARQPARQKPAATEKEAPRTIVESEPVRNKTVEAENRYEPTPNDGSFLRQKGRMRFPVRGTVTGRFGAAREGSGTWRGLFIKASVGSDIKAVAHGRVVFAEWMRGFGNLLIIDHGDSYLSIYGYNDSLLKQVGQAVKGGETIATAGNSGGNQDSGLYFELRHQGQPIDPMKWASLK